MSAKDATQMRVELARGHWQLGERAEAITCLERAAKGEPRHEPLLALVDACLEDLEGTGADAFESRLLGLRNTLVQALETSAPTPVPAPLATPTLAKLLAEQGHAEQALAVADDVLRRNPSDSRALAVRNSIQPERREPERREPERREPPPAEPVPIAAPAPVAAPQRPTPRSRERKRATLERWLAAARNRPHQGGRPA